MDLTSLKRLAEAARQDFRDFDMPWPETVQDVRAIDPTTVVALYIAALSPDKLLKLIAAVEAAKYVGYSNGFDAAYPDKLEGLRSALKELDK